MRHGLTLGELGRWFVSTLQLDVDYRVVDDGGLGAGRPRRASAGRSASAAGSTPAPTRRICRMARCYAGTVMLEGTTLSEGRGTTRPAGAVRRARPGRAARCSPRCTRWRPQWLRGLPRCATAGSSRPSTSTPASSAPACRSTWRIRPTTIAAFRPWRLQALAFKALRALRPDYPLWRDFPYEYELGRLAIDVINGGPLLREWVDDPAATPGDLDVLAGRDEAAWAEARREFLLYPPVQGGANGSTATGR